MPREIEIVLTPDILNNDEAIRRIISAKLNVNTEAITAVRTLRRSLDARPRDPVYRVQCAVYINEPPAVEQRAVNYRDVHNSPEVHIIGFGPAGMFAALRLLEEGYKPVVFERGKDVRERRFDLRNIQQKHIVNPESNYCFGEGGAGTYSDGKLYTRSTKRGDVKKILAVLHNHGADADIMVESHPHIGSNKLPNIVKNIRETIIKHGGEMHFNSRVTDFIISNDRLTGLIINNEKEVPVKAVILACGHSARDIYLLLNEKGVLIESKPFAVGVRVEHPQELISKIFYHNSGLIPVLPPAAYGLTCQYNTDGVFSFCMCPGGIIVPASTAPGELVLNGMSVSRRNSPFANSGFVVTVDENDYKPYAHYGALKGLYYQKEIEEKAFKMSGKQKAPAQRLTDFLAGNASQSLPASSYIPGLFPAQLNEILPEKIINGMKHGLIEFDKKHRGFITSEAVFAAPETRTSSPVRIPRDRESGQHIKTTGLFPAGEGAGYAGGIVSSAIDGEFAAVSVIRALGKSIL